MIVFSQDDTQDGDASGTASSRAELTDPREIDSPGRRQRLDKLMTDKGLVGSRTRAQALIMEGKVRVDGERKTKPGEMVRNTALIEIEGEDMAYVSRGGLKMEAALEAFPVVVKDRVAMDVGASTGGFTDCLLQRGARRVYAVDVGYGQLAWKLRQDPRVVVIERTNARYLDRRRIPEDVDIVTLDVSFISLVKVVPPLMKFLAEGAHVIALVKPQFEAGRGAVGKGGVVRDEGIRRKAVSDVKEALEGLGLETVGVAVSPIKGPKGNVEFFLCMRKRDDGQAGS